MASFLELKRSEVWVSMLVGYFDRELRFYRVLVAIIGMYFYLIIEKGKKEAIVFEFDSEEEAKVWVEKNMLNCNLLETKPFWTHFYSPYFSWLEEEFNIKSSNFIEIRVTLPTTSGGEGQKEVRCLSGDIEDWAESLFLELREDL